MDEAGKDPVKRAQMIQEVVRSVSVVPDRIERTVYLQECSRMLGVEEQILFTEAARMKRKQWEQKRGGGHYTPEPRFLSPHQPPPPPEPETGAALFETEEHEILRLMINYPDKKVYDLAGEKHGEIVPVSVGEFFLQEMETDGLVPENPLYSKMFREFQLVWGREGINIQTWFINHHDPDISRLAVDLLTPGHQISKIHERNGAYVRTEEQMLKIIAPKTLASYRVKKVKQMISVINEQIHQIQGTEEDHLIPELLESKRQLEELRKAFSRELGRVVI
jgi:DNA primase